MIDSRKMQEVMKRYNLNIAEIPAEQVVIKCKDKNIVISKPEVMKTEMMGKDVYQITGEISEEPSIKEDDIRLVMEQTGKDRKTVIDTLEKLDNDLAKAVMELRKTI